MGQLINELILEYKTDLDKLSAGGKITFLQELKRLLERKSKEE